ncbi:MAG: hypothetical protein A2359_01730 [Candidatus Moranbacteria bacterium RIFOXYB1_FULL_43_19]|nr:MAG: hypothetical protein A2359_01730 [Candidatus Moranbacteria bacterium RIFOXYB1_FULL_43_19]OGI29057.1 MAG: hypothetical protein A2184_01225 [Candidatus Moranbacteria bacterium RIFOXYA1_FULL_44_7]OGI33050.1 MAG: hypothetical protein A2420_04505 [Candidatus Moranbacteria bacterium RIFOXYC1_FULL_44_13]
MIKMNQENEPHTKYRMNKISSDKKCNWFFCQDLVWGKNFSAGFTLLEILLVIALIAILAVIVIFAINPGRQLAQARNAQRKVDTNTILNAVYQYALDNNGNLPDGIQSAANCLDASEAEICQTGHSDYCHVNLSELTDSGRYLVSMPQDPSGPYATANGVGYLAVKDANSRVTICAPGAELEETISVTR